MEPYFRDEYLTLYCGHAAAILPQLEPKLVQAIITSPPYWNLRDYGVLGQLGAEPTPADYACTLASTLGGGRRALRDDGTMYLNIGDSYITNPGNGRGGERVEGGVPHRSSADKTGSGLATKNLAGIPWRAAFALQDDGWILRSDVIWEKPNVKPDGARDRPTVSHEYLFLLANRPRYYYDREAVLEPATGAGQRSGQGSGRGDGQGTRNRRTVWRIPTAPYRGAHFACWPPELARILIRSTTRPGDIVLDPFFGAGTTALVARELGRRTIGVELNPDYCDLALRRLGYR